MDYGVTQRAALVTLRLEMGLIFGWNAKTLSIVVASIVCRVDSN
jgi:hypothetical protein